MTEEKQSLRPLTRREWGSGHWVGDGCQPAHGELEAGHGLAFRAGERPVHCATCGTDFASVLEHEDALG